MTKCEKCDNDAVGIAPVYDEAGKWLGNKSLCQSCIARLPTGITKEETKKRKKERR